MKNRKIKGKRFITSNILTTPRARMEQVAHSEVYARDGSDRMLPGVSSIEKPEIDYNEKEYKLIKEYTPGPVDTIFDLFGMLSSISPAGGVFTPIAGQRRLLREYVVPASMRLVINQYCFFILVDDTPASNHPVCASPFEMLSLANCNAYSDFVIYSNGKVPGNMAYSVNQIESETEGFVCLTSNPNEASIPSHGGMHIMFDPGTRLEIYFRNYSYAFGLPNTRRWEGLGYRLRGFLTPVDVREGRVI